MQKLLDYLSSLPAGSISDTSELEPLLANCWDKLGGYETNMSGEKLNGRMEEVEWNPPILHFVIERHGGTVLGSSRADLCHWVVNVQECSAVLDKTGRRQLHPMAAKLDVRPIAKEIAGLIFQLQQDERLKWYPDGRVRIEIGKIIPKESSKYKSTLVDRRRRFRAALDKELNEGGWEQVKLHVYRPRSE